MFQAYTSGSVAYAQNSKVKFARIKYDDNRYSYPSSDEVIIKSPGKYLVQFNGVGSSTAADAAFTLQMYVNGVAAPEAISTITPAAIGEEQTMSINTIVTVPRSCCVVDNNTSLSLVAISETTGNLSLANIIITKLR